ncbi:MAG: cob(I)yrinic acid a,c-diamide adenosyltransferase [Actinomycetota bacterium]
MTAESRVLVNTGNGKGKTTAALGTVMRAVARGWRVCVIQFLKSGKWKVGEEKVGRELGVDWWSIGDGFTWDSTDMDATEALGRAAWAAAKEKISSGEYDMVMLDEITYAMNWGWIPAAEVVEVIRNRPPNVNVIATGRDAPPELIEVADTVTEMVPIRHAFDQGIPGRKGIEF